MTIVTGTNPKKESLMIRNLKILIALVIFSLTLLTPWQSATAVVPKTGASCAKIGQVLDYQGKRFTCIKSGSKRVWSKGSAIPTAARPTSTPTASPTPAASKTPSSPSPTSTTREYTLAEVQTHNTVSNCWSVINGDVYNLTTWIGSHPGGAAAITQLCGTDGTRAFNNQHEGEGKVMRQLGLFNIGRLKS